MQNYSEFGLKARTIMLQKNIKSSAIAKELGVSCSYVAEILKGSRSGNGRKEQIAKILGMEEELVQEEVAMK